MRRRRGVGIGYGIARKKKMEKFKKIGSEYANAEVKGMKERLDFFKGNLEEFAKKHKKEINSEPEFRHYFSKICRKIGVDPLASSKGFWASLLGIGDFYYEIGIQVSQICYARRNENGGLMELEEALSMLRKRRKNDKKISKEDVAKAIDKMKVLGNGLKIFRINGRDFIQSVPYELSDDNTSILDKCQSLDGGITQEELKKKMGWESDDRLTNALLLLQEEGIVWVVDEDTKSGSPEYWFPGFVIRNRQQQQKNVK